jgi:hypothetical protein
MADARAARLAEIRMRVASGFEDAAADDRDWLLAEVDRLEKQCARLDREACVLDDIGCAAQEREARLRAALSQHARWHWEKTGACFHCGSHVAGGKHDPACIAFEALLDAPKPAPSPQNSAPLFVVKHAKTDLWVVERRGGAARWASREEAVTATRAEWDAWLNPDVRHLLVLEPADAPKPEGG